MGEIMGFWIIIAAISLLTAAVLLLPLIRRRSGDMPAAAFDLQVYRDQLKEVDRDLARGVIAAAEAERVRTEISRRVLAADDELQAQLAAGAGQTRGNSLIAVALVGAMVLGSVALYTRLGAPGYGDLPLEARIAASENARQARLSQSVAESRASARPPAAEASPEYLELMEKLRQTVEDRPDDLRGLRLLVRNEAALGNVTDAYAAQQSVIRILGPGATADDYGLLADLMIAAADGYVSAEAEAALRDSLQRDPAHPTSRYYLGLYLMQVDRPDAAFRTWEQLLRDSRPDAPWVAPIRNQIEDLAWRAGVKYELPALSAPAPTPGPTRDDIEAAQDLNMEERDEMIRGMVQRLAERIDNDGGPPEDWIRLISAYGVLGETGLAGAVWEEARQAFWDAPESLARIREAAIQAGVAE